MSVVARYRQDTGRQANIDDLVELLAKAGKRRGELLKSLPEFVAHGRLLIAPTAGAGLGLYALERVTGKVGPYGQRASAYFSPHRHPTVLVVGTAAGLTMEALGVDLSTYGWLVGARSDHFSCMYRKYRGLSKEAKVPMPAKDEFVARWCSAEFVDYANGVALRCAGIVPNEPKKPKFLENGVFEMVLIQEGLAGIVEGIERTIVPLAKDAAGRPVCPGESVVARVNVAERGNKKAANCKFTGTAEGPMLVTTRDVLPGEQLLCDTYGHEFKGLHDSVDCAQVLSRLRDDCLASPYEEFARESLFLAVRTFRRVSAAFSVEGARLDATKSFLAKEAQGKAFRSRATLSLAAWAGLAKRGTAPRPGTILLFKSQEEWWTGIVDGEATFRKNGRVSARIRMVREDMCFNQVVPSKANTSKAWANGFLNRVQSFSLGNDFTASVRPPGAALKHISEYEEHDYCILTHAIDWEDGDVPLPETLERRAVLAIGKAWNAAATGLKAAIVERDVARGPHRSPTTDDEEKAFVWNYLFKAGATLSQLTRTSRYEPFNVVVRPDPEETDEDEEQAPCYPLRLSRATRSSTKYWEVDVDSPCRTVVLRFWKNRDAPKQKRVLCKSLSAAYEYAKQREAEKRGKGYSGPTREKPPTPTRKRSTALRHKTTLPLRNNKKKTTMPLRHKKTLPLRHKKKTLPRQAWRRWRRRRRRVLPARRRWTLCLRR